MEAKTCNTLEEVREEIDTVDAVIVELLAKRNAYIKQLAYFKNDISEIKDEKRINDVLSRARHNALAQGLSPALVSEIFSLMIEEMVETEVAEYRNAKNF